MSVDLSGMHQHYVQYAERHGATPQGVAWGMDEKRVICRYRSITSKIPFGNGNNTILDVGCGYGELIKHFPETILSYTGIDITESSIVYGRSLYPEYKFIHDDFLNYEFDELFDIVVCNGALNVKMDISNKDMLVLVQRMVLKMYALCKEAVIFNMMSTNVNFFSSGMFYKSPVEMLAWCFDNIGGKIDIDHSSVEYEYIITLRK